MRGYFSIFLLFFLFMSIAILSGYKSENSSSGCNSPPEIIVSKPVENDNIENPPVSVEFTAIQNSTDLTSVDLGKVSAIIRDNMNKVVDISQYIASSCDFLKKNCSFKGEVNLSEGEYILEVRVCNTAAACSNKEVRFYVLILPRDILDKWAEDLRKSISKVRDLIYRLFSCNDGIDNDGDGYTDMDDDKCDNALSIGERYNKSLEAEHTIIKGVERSGKVMLGLLKIELDPDDLPVDINYLKIKITRRPYLPNGDKVLSFNDRYIIETPDYPEGITLRVRDYVQGMSIMRLIYRDEDSDTASTIEGGDFIIKIKDREGYGIHEEGSMQWPYKNGLQIASAYLGGGRVIEGYDNSKFIKEGYELIETSEDPFDYSPTNSGKYVEVTDPNVVKDKCGGATYCILGCANSVICPECYKIHLDTFPYEKYCCATFPEYGQCIGECIGEIGECHGPYAPKCIFEGMPHSAKECYGWMEGAIVQARAPRKTGNDINYRVEKYKVKGSCEEIIQQFKYKRDVCKYDWESGEYKCEKKKYAAETRCRAEVGYYIPPPICENKDMGYCCKTKAKPTKIKKNIVMELPDWIDVPPECREKWNKFLDEVKYHEYLHKDICSRCLDNYENYFIYNFQGEYNETSVCGSEDDEKELINSSMANAKNLLEAMIKKKDKECQEEHNRLDGWNSVEDKLIFECPCNK